jgi:hypothetical protein
MTNAPITAPASAARKRRRPSPGLIIVTSTLAFLALFAFLSYRLGAGKDPALGGKAAASGPKKVLVRRIIQKRVITTVVPSAGSGGGLGATVSSPSAPVVSAPVSVAPAPVTSSS